MSETILIRADEMNQAFYEILLRHDFDRQKATTCAEIFTETTVDGVYTHGVNRFPVFIELIQKKFINPRAEPSLKEAMGGLEQWDGHLGPGILNALHATDRAMQLADQHGLGCVSLANTNHWMRGGSYGWKAAKVGFIFIGWSNTVANMPAWNAMDLRLGNNPLVVALPFNNEAIVLDMAMSQLSYGALEKAAAAKETLSVHAGYTENGQLTKDAAAILESKRMLPIGYWKGAGLSLLLDLLATILSSGQSVHEISKHEVEHGLSQVFIAIDINRLDRLAIKLAVGRIIEDYHESIPVDQSKRILYPGERVLATRKKNLSDGIPVDEVIWKKIKSL